MKKIRRRTIRLWALCLAVVTISACGYLVSVPALRNADNNQIVNVGDSIYALSGDIFKNLEAKAGETWRHYAVSGAQMIGGVLAPTIPSQYQQARSDHPDIRVVYMDGGGNDILLQALAGDWYDCRQCNDWWCGDISQSCKDLIDDVSVEEANLLNRMAGDGVQQVVMLGYYHPTVGIFGDLRNLRKAVDYGARMSQQACQSSSANVAYLDPRSRFDGHESDYIIFDGIHPSGAGSSVLANMIWDVIDF